MQIVWHRNDLRVHDHPALAAALSAGPAVGVVFLPRRTGEAIRPRDALYVRSAAALRVEYEARGGTLLVRSGSPAVTLSELARSLGGAAHVHALAGAAPPDRAEESECERALRSAGAELRLHDGAYVHAPGTFRTTDDTFYTVFSAFFRRWHQDGTPAPLDPPARIPAPPAASALKAGEVPDIRPAVPLPPPGEADALDALERFATERLPDYARDRDRLDGRGTSHLSPWLAVGALSPRTAATRVEAAAGQRGGPDGKKWLSELAWRDFLADLLYHRPDMVDAPFDPRWRALTWPGGQDRFVAWREGRTGIAAVDAAMRQLDRTGWISNRARMVAAQFLAKNLRVDWRRGAAVFEEKLLDADVASNTGNWQWAAGLGIDNAPYFRVMNPDTQAERHDPDGEWRRRWAPDSGDATPDHPIVDLKASRRAYLEAAKRARAEPPPP